MKIKRILEIAYHRNGICGAPFYIVRFVDHENRDMLAMVFDAPGHVAVLQEALLPCITFGVNSWRGDEYEDELRKAIAAKETEDQVWFETQEAAIAPKH